MQIPSIPDQVSIEAVREALSSLGIPVHDRLVETRITAGSIELTFLRTASADDAHPEDVVVGSYDPGKQMLSKVTTTIGVKHPKR
jgi:hypothetical protein